MMPGQNDAVANVRELTPSDQPWKLITLRTGWGSTDVARFGELLDAAPLPGFVALHRSERAALVTYAERSDGIEIVTLQSLVEGEGLGRALMDRMRMFALGRDAPRLWLSTTNDNVRAFSFYQRWGMDLVRFIRDGAEASRQVKPSIPVLGQHGIPLRHELEFELRLEGEAQKYRWSV